MALLRHAAIHNPFHSRYFLWVDIGIDRASFFETGVRWPANFAPLMGNKILVNDVSQGVEQCSDSDWENWNGSPGAFMDFILQRHAFPHLGIGGGIFGGTAAAVLALHREYFPMLAAFLYMGKTSLTDQVVLARLASAALIRPPPRTRVQSPPLNGV